jgi:hypothetical protein
MQRFMILEGSKFPGENIPQFHDFESALSFLNPLMHEPQCMQAIRKFISNTLFYGNISRLSNQQVLEQFARELLRGCYYFRRLPFFGQSSAGGPTAFITAAELPIVRSKTNQQRIREPVQQSKREKIQPPVHKQVQFLKNEPVQHLVQEAVQLAKQESGLSSILEPIQLVEEMSWIEILLVGEDKIPIPGECYRIILPNGITVAEGKLDTKGKARVTNIDPGICRITFPNLDQEAWVGA